MPHFGLMDATQMREAEAELLRARLHIRGGNRRLRQGKDAAGIASLYDALIHSLRWYALENQAALEIADKTELRDEREIFARLACAQVLNDLAMFDALTSLVEKAIDDPTLRFDAAGESAKIENWLTRLGVIPFDETALPPEAPTTP
jgi:hypothetical protein